MIDRVRGFDQQLQPMPDEGSEVLGPQFGFEVSESFDTFAAYRLGDLVVGHVGGGGSASGAERERVDFGEPGGAARIERLFEFGFGFAREPRDHVGGQGGTVEGIAEQSAAVEKHPRAPASPHPPEHRVAAALQAEVQMGDDSIGVVGHHADQLAGHFGRLDAAEPDTEWRRQVAEFTE